MPSLPRDSPEYRQQNIQANGTKQVMAPLVEQRQQTAPQDGQSQTQAQDCPREELKRLGTYVLQEFKKMKVSLPLIELMKIPEIQETLLNSLTEVVAPRSTSPNMPNRNIHNAPANTNVIQDTQEMSIDALQQQPPNFVGMVQTSSRSSKQEEIIPVVLGDTDIFQEEILTNELPLASQKKEKGQSKNNQIKHPMILYQGKDEPPLFLLSIKIFRKLVHNCLVDSGASSNVMPLVMCEKLGVIPTWTNKKVTKLDKTEVPMIGELNNIHMQLAANPRVQSCIEISIFDIPNGYGMLLSRDWSRKLKGYISTDFSHMWLSWKGVPNQIKIDCTPKLNLMIIEYGENNEMLFLETDLGSYKPKVGEILTLHESSKKKKAKKGSKPEPAVVAPNDQNKDERLFESFKDFIWTNVGQKVIEE